MAALTQAHDRKSPPFYPTGVLNGYLTAAPNRHAPTTDKDHAPREFLRYANGSGISDVQLWNGLRKRVASGRRVPFVTFLYAANARIPGQMRDDYGGKHKHGIGPLEYQNIWRNGPGSQPADPGGTRQFYGDFLMNPGTS